MHEPVTREQVEAIAHEVMAEQTSTLVFELEALREELRQINEGERVVMPVDQQHAECMFKLASLYLGFWNPMDEQFKLKGD